MTFAGPAALAVLLLGSLAGYLTRTSGRRSSRRFQAKQ